MGGNYLGRKMRAAVVEKPNVLKIKEVEIPEINGEEV